MAPAVCAPIDAKPHRRVDRNEVNIIGRLEIRDVADRRHA
jgi:hypothetical protein